MAEQSKPTYITVRDCLNNLGISSISEWDVLVFLYHQGASLSADQIAWLLRYSRKEVGRALDKLLSREIIRRSRSSEGVRVYRFAAAQMDLLAKGCLRRLLVLTEDRSGRLLIVNLMPHSAGLHMAEIDKQDETKYDGDDAYSEAEGNP